MAHDTEPDPLKLQPVLPQILPDQFAGACSEREAPDVSSNPVILRTGPALEIPGQTVKLQSFTTVIVAPEAPANVTKNAFRTKS